jgi:hypothetical protein
MSLVGPLAFISDEQEKITIAFSLHLLGTFPTLWRILVPGPGLLRRTLGGRVPSRKQENDPILHISVPGTRILHIVGNVPFIRRLYSEHSLLINLSCKEDALYMYVA